MNTAELLRFIRIYVPVGIEHLYEVRPTDLTDGTESLTIGICHDNDDVAMVRLYPNIKNFKHDLMDVSSEVFYTAYTIDEWQAFVGSPNQAVDLIVDMILSTVVYVARELRVSDV